MEEVTRIITKREMSQTRAERERERKERWEYEEGIWWRLFTRVTGCGTDSPVVRGLYGFMVWPFACCIKLPEAFM